MTTTEIVFLVRASVGDGLGHLVRSLCVVREMVFRARVRLIVLGDLSGEHLIRDTNISWIHCSTDTQAAGIVLETKPKVVVFDMLNFDEREFERICNCSLTVSLSPVFSHMAKVQHLFHRTVYEHPSWSGSPIFPKIHKGLRYAILPSWLKRLGSPQYVEQVGESKLSVGISMGGADAPNRTLALLKRLGQSSTRFVVWVALGDAYVHSYSELLECADQNRQEIIFIKSNDSMWRVLRNSSLIVCAGGMTTYESAFIGIPTINVMQETGWSFLFHELDEHGACVTIAPASDSLDQAVKLILEFEQNRGKLLTMHRSSKGLIPKNGAARVATELTSINQKLHS